MAAVSNKRLAIIHDFEKQNQSNLHKTELIHRDEEARLLRLRALTLRDGYAMLDEKLTEKDQQIEDLTKYGDQTSRELDSERRNSRSKEAQLHKQALELADLRAELQNYNGTVHDSTKIMQEKFSLSRELDRLRPEMEHLQSQLADYQVVVAQKLDLQRRIESLENDYRKEKLKQRNYDEVDAQVDELKTRLEEAEEKAAIVQKERDRIQSEHEKQLAETQGLTERLEERISSLKTKLKGAQGELKEKQVELETCQIALREARNNLRQNQDRRKEPLAVNLPPKSTKSGSRKTDNGYAVQTPSKDESIYRPIKKRATEQALLGEKSTFSITPFLSRTKNVLDDSVDEESHVEDPESAGAADDDPASVHFTNELPETEKQAKSHQSGEASKTKQPHKARGRPRANPLSTNPSAEKAKVSSTTKRVKSQISKPLGKVIEEPGEEDGEPSATLVPALPIAGNASTFAINGKKRRKLLGGTNRSIFEEDGETIQQPAKNTMGPPRRLAPPLKGTMGKFASGGAFSPLKRDRRGVNASFLA